MIEHGPRRAARLTALCAFLLLTLPATADEAPAGRLEQVRKLRLEGALHEAIELAERGLDRPGQSPADRIALHLELARIHDRTGLHYNSRPVVAALRHIEAAEALIEDPTPTIRAALALQRADYHYRARDYQLATPLTEDAIRWFRQVGDAHGEADAVHKLGLIHFQRGENDRAKELYDRSLELDRQDGERATFCGDYQRHVGLIHLRRGETEDAIPYFERSLACRRAAGATDASMFAANILASTLVAEGRIEDAHVPLLYAMMLAEKLNSPGGKARNGLILARIYDRSKDPEAARHAYRMTLRLAESIGLDSIVQRCKSALEQAPSMGIGH